MLKPIFPRWIYTELKNGSLLISSFKLEQKNASECGIFTIHHMPILITKRLKQVVGFFPCLKTWQCMKNQTPATS